MAEMNFGGVIETVVTSKEFSLEKAREVLKDEVIAVIGYGVQGPGQACNLRDNGFNVIVGQRQGKTFDKAVADGWVPGKTLFSIEEAAEKGTILCMLLSDAGQMQQWPTIKQYLKPGKTLYYSHGFAINWSDRTGVVPPKDVDVIMVAPKGSGTSLRTMFCEGRGLNCSYAVYQDASGKAKEKTLAFGIGIGAGYMFETTFQREATLSRACCWRSMKCCARMVTHLLRLSTRLLRSSPRALARCSALRVWTGCMPTVRPLLSVVHWTGLPVSTMPSSPLWSGCTTQ